MANNSPKGCSSLNFERIMDLGKEGGNGNRKLLNGLTTTMVEKDDEG